MRLTKPEPYRPDPGRSLAPDEFVQAAREATPISKIKNRSCWREGDNDKYRLGRK